MPGQYPRAEIHAFNAEHRRRMADKGCLGHQAVTTMWRPGSGDWSWPVEAADLIRRDGPVLADLIEDVDRNGIRVPVLLGDDGRVWDGHHRVIAALLTGQDVPVRAGHAGTGLTGAVVEVDSVPVVADEWAGIPADPRWDPYRLRVSRPRWWRPWWTACIEYVGAWVSHGDQTIIVVRSWARVRAWARAVDALIGHCQRLAERAEYADGTVPVVWQGPWLVPVAHLAGRSVNQWSAGEKSPVAGAPKTAPGLQAVND